MESIGFIWFIESVESVEFVEFVMPQAYGFDCGPLAYMSPIEAVTDSLAKTIVFSQEVYDGLFENNVRARFTAAHEVGHALLHSDSGGTKHMQRRNNLEKGQVVLDKELEWQANVFAAALLMPTSAVVQYTMKNGWSKRRMARTFDVSIPAARTRLQDLVKMGIIRKEAESFYDPNSGMITRTVVLSEQWTSKQETIRHVVNRSRLAKGWRTY